MKCACARACAHARTTPGPHCPKEKNSADVQLLSVPMLRQMSDQWRQVCRFVQMQSCCGLLFFLTYLTTTELTDGIAYTHPTSAVWNVRENCLHTISEARRISMCKMVMLLTQRALSPCSNPSPPSTYSIPLQISVYCHGENQGMNQNVIFIIF